MKIAYHYNYSTLVYAGKSEVHELAGYKEYILPQFATWTAIPEFDQETEQAKFDVENHQWFVELIFVKITVYHKQTQKQKEFDDKSLVTTDYTVKKPLTPFDEYVSGKWVTNLSNKYIAEYDQVDSARRAAYREVSDPLYMEAFRKESQGFAEEAMAYRNQADAAVVLIQAEHPWPTPPEV